MAADLELDSTKEAAEAQIAAPTGALGRYAPLIAAFCRSKCVESEEIIIWKVSFAEQRLQSNTAASNCQGSAIIAGPVANSVAFSRSALCWCQARLATPRLSMACSVSERRLLIIILDEKHVHVRLPLQRLNGRGREAEVLRAPGADEADGRRCGLLRGQPAPRLHAAPQQVRAVWPARQRTEA